jgi:hypothetical protein
MPQAKEEKLPGLIGRCSKEFDKICHRSWHPALSNPGTDGNINNSMTNSFRKSFPANVLISGENMGLSHKDQEQERGIFVF